MEHGQIKRSALMIYLDSAAAIYMLSDSDSGKLFKAMLMYASDGTLPEFEGSLAIVWALIKPKIDFDGERYLKAVYHGQYGAYKREAARKGIPYYETYDEWYENVSSSKDTCVDLSILKDTHPNTYINPNPKPKSETNTEANSKNADKPHGTKTFVKPTVDEINEYCRSRNNSIDAEAFYDYYQANGWKAGRNAMKDWRATLRNWERNQIQNKTNKTGNRSRTAADYQKDSEDSL